MQAIVRQNILFESYSYTLGPAPYLSTTQLQRHEGVYTFQEGHLPRTSRNGAQKVLLLGIPSIPLPRKKWGPIYSVIRPPRAPQTTLKSMPSLSTIVVT